MPLKGQVKWNAAVPMTDNTQNEPRPSEPEHQRNSVEELLRRVDALPTIDSRAPEEILGYDENGLPS
jgi:hypothetical protein